MCTKLAFKGSNSYVSRSINAMSFKYCIPKYRIMTSPLTVLLHTVNEAKEEKNACLLFKAGFIQELIKLKDCGSVIDISRREINEIITYLCEN